MRSRFRSTSSTSTSTSWPTLTTSEGWLTWFQESSEMWTRPSIPPRSTKAPKSTMEETAPWRRMPDLSFDRISERSALRDLLEHHAAGEDDVVAVAVHLDDAGLDTGAHVGVEVLDATKVDQGGGQEAAQADIEDKAALDDLDDLALDVLAGVELLLDTVPGTLVLGTLLGRGSDGRPCPPSGERGPRSRSPRATIVLGSASLRIESSRTGMTPSDL